MPRPATSEEIVREIEDIWAEDVHQSARYVYLEARRRIGSCPGIRKVQLIVRDAKRRASPIPDDPPIVPWGDDWPQDPAQIAALFRVMASARVARHHLLTTREAEWVKKLSGLFDYSGLVGAAEGDLAYTHFNFAWAYAQRERAGEILKRSAFYEDLDGLVMFSPWATDNDQRFESYQKAVQNGLVPSYDPAIFTEAGEVIYPGHTERSEAVWKIHEAYIAMEEIMNAEDRQDAESVPDETPE